jgi:tetratricopeptide (TPR) repeat protein
MLSAEERRDVHRLALVATRETFADALTRVPALLFTHAQRGEDPVAAREAAVHAVRRATQLHDDRQALALVDAALIACEDDDDLSREARFELLAARERIHDGREGADAREARARDLKEMAALASGLGGGPWSGLVLHRQARLHLMNGELELAKAAGEAALRPLENGHPLDLSNALRTVALIRWQERSVNAAVAALEAALQIYERLGHRRGMGFVLHNLGVFSLDSGALEHAEGYLTRALAIKESAEETMGVAAVREALGQLCALGGDTEGAIGHLEAALEARETNHDRPGMANTLASLAEATVGSDGERALTLARRALSISRKIGAPRAEAAAQLVLATVRLHRGQRRQALRDAVGAAGAATRAQAKILEARARLSQAEIHLAFASAEHDQQAVVDAEAAAALTLKLGALRWRIDALSVLATALSRLDPAQALPVAKEALSTMTKRRYAGLDEALIRRRCEAVFAAAGA